MPLRRLLLALSVALAVTLVIWRFATIEKNGGAARTAAPVTTAPVTPASKPALPIPVVSEDAPSSSPRPAALQRLTYAVAWTEAQPPAFAEFRDWTARFLAAGSDPERTALEAIGLGLARARHAAMRALMERDPKAAFALTVPVGVRSALPAAIQAELETRFSTRGDFSVLVFDYSAAEIARRRELGLRTDTFQYTVGFDGRVLPAFVYGRRTEQTTKEGIPLHGLLLDGAVALHETALRLVEPGEALPADAPRGDLHAELAGRVLAFASSSDLLAGEARQETAERGLGPVPSPIPDGARPTATIPGTNQIPVNAAPTTAWTVGNKSVLVIRVDFSDLTGEPRRGSTTYTQTYVQNLSDTEVAPFYAQSSYGLTSLTTTVTSQVYRMPQTATAYATTGNNDQLHTDARTAANANYAVNTYDRILVLFSSLGGISGSAITYGGLAQIGGKYSWINGEYDFRVVSHELGHTYGLSHANVWKVSDGDPLSANGSSTEYGDDYDTMGANFANDHNTDFNPWFKNLLGWAPDGQIQAVTASGTYRINRFDNSTGTGTLALKFTRDATRNYWVGVRRNFTTNASMQHGAYVMWGYNSNQQSNLLDLNTPGTSVADAALAIGPTLLDTVGNLSLRALSEGGTAPNEYLDLQVTLGLNGIPVFNVQPQSQGYSIGGTVTLSVNVSGTAPLSYQWKKNDVAIAGATNATYTIANAQATDAGSYTVTATNSVGSATSAPAVIAVNAAPTIASSPPHTAAAAGQTVILGVAASGSPAPTYQWRKGGANISGATNSALIFFSVQATDAGNYDVVVTNSFGTLTSSSASLTVFSATTPPSNDNFSSAWTLTPNAGLALGSSAGATGEAGEPTHVNANGTASSVWYKWTPTVSGTAQVDTIGSGFDTVLAVYTGSAVSALTKVGEDDQSGGFNTSRLVFPVTAGTTYSIAVGDWSSTRAGGMVQLHYAVFVAPGITTQPANQISTVGGTASFSVAATGTSLAYQWFRNGTPLAGATTATLNLSNLTVADAGSYQVVISNVAGTVTSSTVTLSGSNAAPTITTQPANLTATAGQSASLTVAASGTGTLGYQWRRNGLPLAGATAATLTFPAISRVDVDNYDVIVAAGLSVTVSQTVHVAVAPTSYPAIVAPDPAWELRPEAPSGIFGYAIAPLADGRAYLAGSFVSLDGVRRAGIARLNADGTLDSTFLPPEIDNVIRAVVVQSDGRVVIAGDFVRVDGLVRNRVARLNANGTVDPSFNAGTAANNSVNALALQSDGRILVGGAFTGFAGSLRNFLARLNADGSLDNGFLNRGFTATVNALAVQTDGRIIAGGGFSVGFVDNNGNTTSRQRVARLNSDGTLDNGYFPAPNSTVNALALQSDGRLVIGGSFTTVNGNAAGDIARLNSDGSFDFAFNATAGTGFNGSVLALALDASGKILAGGNFTTFAGATANRFARLTTAGARDTGLLTQGFTSSVTSIGVLPSGRILVGGGFANYYNASGATTLRLRFARLNSDGTLDSAVNFNPRAAGSIGAIVPTPDGKMLVAGYFSAVRGTAVPNSIVRVAPDGTVDSTFNSGGLGANSNVLAVLRQPDGRILITGAFSLYNNSSTYGLARLKDDGTLDPTFTLGSGFGGFGWGNTLALLPGGRLFVGGFFSSFNGTARGNVAVINADGSLDTTFNPGTGADASVYACAVQPDGKIIIAGSFTTYNGATATRLARLNVNGTLDPSFNGGTSRANSDVAAIALQPDGKIVLAGLFTSYDGVARNGVARVTSTGALDSSFNPPVLSGANSLLVQEDGKIVVRGSFPSVDSANATACLTRLNSDGTRDTGFRVGGFVPSTIWPAALVMNDSGSLFMHSAGSPGLSATLASAVPEITTPPASQAVFAGGSVTLSAVAGSTLPVSYQWQFNGSAIAGATNSTLTLTNVQSANVGAYTVAVTSELGVTVSSAANITIADSSRSLIVGTARAKISGGPLALAGAFTIEGATSKKVLIRAVGPTLANFSVPGYLSDSALTLVNASTGATVATSDNWSSESNAAQIAAVATQVGAFALNSPSADAAILATLAPGTYRAIATGVLAAGTASLEVYDADTTPRLVYFAARAFAGVGDAQMAQGVTLAAPVAGRSYLIRALGPALNFSDSNLTTHADPQLLVYSGATLVASNDNWGGDSAIVALAASVGAMPLPAASKDAALIFTPTAVGSYTITVSGSGIALLEIFEADSTRAATIAPAVVSAFDSLSVVAGAPASLGVVTLGKPAPTYQWRKNSTAIAGATLAALAFPSTSTADAGSYDVVVTNSAGTATSPAATLTVTAPTTNSATHAVVGAGYVAGGTVTITNTLLFAGVPTSLGWSATIPAGWSFASDSGAAGDVKPVVGTTGTLEWAWTSIPANPVTFTYTLNVPAGETVDRTIAASAIVRVSGAVNTVTVTPNPLTVPRIVYHHADTNRDGKLSLLELTRVIELYNTRNGTTRTGCYKVDATGEDGFNPEPTRAGTASATLTLYHSADTNHDGKLSLLELTRVIELYNTRSGTTRTGQYHAQAGTEDGFAAGP